MGISPEEVEAMLHAKLEPLGLKIEKKQSFVDPDDDDNVDEFGDDVDDKNDGSDDDDMDDED